MEYYLHLVLFCLKKNITFAVSKKIIRDVAQSGLEYTSGGRVVAGSNPVIPTFLLNFLSEIIYGGVWRSW